MPAKKPRSVAKKRKPSFPAIRTVADLRSAYEQTLTLEGQARFDSVAAEVADFLRLGALGAVVTPPGEAGARPDIDRNQMLRYILMAEAVFNWFEASWPGRQFERPFELRAFVDRVLTTT